MQTFLNPLENHNMLWLNYMKQQKRRGRSLFLFVNIVSQELALIVTGSLRSSIPWKKYSIFRFIKQPLKIYIYLKVCQIGKIWETSVSQIFFCPEPAQIYAGTGSAGKVERAAIAGHTTLLCALSASWSCIKIIVWSSTCRKWTRRTAWPKTIQASPERGWSAAEGLCLTRMQFYPVHWLKVRCGG